MRIDPVSRTVSFSLDEPMTLPALVQMRESMIDEGGYRDDVRTLDTYIGRMQNKVESLVIALDQRRLERAKDVYSG